MKRMLLLVLATALTAGPALAAVEITGEAFVNHKAILQNTELSAATTPKTQGTDADRFRIFVNNKFNDQWSFRGAFEGKADGNEQFSLPAVNFIGTGIFMERDTIVYGIQTPSQFTLDGMGNRWITRPFVDEEGFLIAGTQSGLSYKMGFNALSISVNSFSAESANNVDSNDNTKMTGAVLEYKFNDSFNLWLSGQGINGVETAGTSVGVALTGTKSTTVTMAGLNYRSDMFDAGFTYASAAYTVETGTAPKNNMGMSLTGTVKNIAGSGTNLYVDFRGGFDKYADTGENTETKVLVGPTWKFADNKINLGVFYQMETFQADYKTANPTAKDPSYAHVKMSARF